MVTFVAATRTARSRSFARSADDLPGTVVGQIATTTQATARSTASAASAYSATPHRCSVGPMSIESQLRSPNTVCLPRVRVSST